MLILAVPVFKSGSVSPPPRVVKTLIWLARAFVLEPSERRNLFLILFFFFKHSSLNTQLELLRREESGHRDGPSVSGCRNVNSDSTKPQCWWSDPGSPRLPAELSAAQVEPYVWETLSRWHALRITTRN